MCEERVVRFSRVTRYRELFQKEILQIDLRLMEARLMNHGPNLLAAGMIQCQIRYFESDGGFRKIEDRIQFTISVGKSHNGSLSTLQTHLLQDYYIFQPAPKDAHAAILEQGFLLSITPLKQLEKAPEWNNLRVHSIVEQGQDSTLLQIPLRPVVPYGEPRNFNGKVRFTDLTALPIATAEIEGYIYEKTSENLMLKTFFKEKASILVNVPFPHQNQGLKITGDIRGVDWQSDGNGANIEMILFLDYRWYLTTIKEVLCLDPGIDNSLPIEQIETVVLRDNGIFHFGKPIQIEVPDLKDFIEIKIEELHHQNIKTQKGLLLHADLTLAFTFINLNGSEQYQEYQTLIDELFPGLASKIPDLSLSIDAVLNCKIIKPTIRNQQILAILDFEYILQIYQKQITAVVTDDSSSEIIDAKTFFGEKVYSFNALENFTMKLHPLRIIKVSGRLLKVTGEAHEGGLSIEGVIEVNITYIDHQRKNHQDLCQMNIKSFYFWDQLKPEMELELDGELEYDYNRFRDRILEYQCLVKINMKAYQQKKIGVRIASDSPQLGFPNEQTEQSSNSQMFMKDLALEWDIPLESGSFHEIAKSQLQISEFHYQESQNAVLIKGCLSGELEYWDHRRYLQTLSLHLPFWRFIQNDDNLQLEQGELVPRVRNCSYFSEQTFPWRKRLKIHLELGFAQN